MSDETKNKGMGAIHHDGGVAFDLWAHQWRRRKAHGDVIVVRYADDFVAGFQHRAEPEQFQRELTDRLREFNL